MNLSFKSIARTARGFLSNIQQRIKRLLIEILKSSNFYLVFASFLLCYITWVSVEDQRHAIDRQLDREDSQLALSRRSLAEQTARMDSQIEISRNSIIDQRKANAAQIGRMDSQLRQSENTKRIQTRAYLYVEQILRTGLPTGEIYVKNSGQSPAHHVRCWGSDSLMQYPSEIILPKGDAHDPSIGDLNPGAVYRIPFELNFKGPDEISAFRHKEKAFYTNGEITYTDIFGASYYIKFRYFMKDSTWNWFLTPTGNESN